MLCFSESLILLSILIAFLLVIYLIRKKYDFGLSLIVGSLIIGVSSLQEITPVDILKAISKATIYSFETDQFITETIELALLMTLIYMLAKLMQETGSIRKLIDSLRTFFSKGGILGLIPSIYGLMPIPGGALFSAPMIDEEGNKYHIDNNQKNMLNIWFRHIWFPIYPISSAMILICSVDFSNIAIYTLIFANVISFITSVGIGVFLLRRYLKPNPIQRLPPAKDYSGIMYLLPLVVPLLFYIILQFFGFPQIRSFLLGVLFSIFLLFFICQLTLHEYMELLKKSLTIKLAIAIFGIMIFRAIFETSHANLIISTIINSLAFPPILIVIVTPLILGVLTGYNLGAIALAYFLVQPFFLLSGISIVGLTSIIFMSSFIGYLISPIHLCNVLSSDFLKTDITRIYKAFIPAASCVLVVQVVFVMLFFRL